MAIITLVSLHSHLRLFEKAADLKRRMPTTSNPRTLKEGLSETGKFIGLDAAVFNAPEQIAALIGKTRFVMIRGEPSVTDHVARIFDGARVLMTVLIDPSHFANPPAGQAGTGYQQGGAMAARSFSPSPAKGEPSPALAPLPAEHDTSIDNLKPLLAGNPRVTGRLLRVLFEHMLGFASPASTTMGSAALATDLIGNKEQGRSFLSAALFVLGAEIDRDGLMPFMAQQGLFGIPSFEHMLRNRDYCDAFHTFRRLELAFRGPSEKEEIKLRNRLDELNVQLGGKPAAMKVIEANQPDTEKIDAYLAATDLLEAMTLTPWAVCLQNAVSIASTNSIRSVSTIAGLFERLSRGHATREQVNREIADHLFAFARQFSADSPPE